MATLNVLVITYNHARFIGECLDSILGQKTQHEITIHVFDDCSTDGTQEIVRTYAARHPTRIKAFLNRRNIGRRQGIQQQVYNGFRSLHGDYIALIEGDDYWSDVNKVEQQIGILEANPKLSACSHNVVKVYDDGKTASHRFHYYETGRTEYDVRDLVGMKTFFHITTMIYRNVHGEKRPTCFRYIRNKWCCEIYVNMLFAQYGPVRYIWKDLSVYRAHAGGSFSGMSEAAGRIHNIEALARYNWWLRFRFLKDFAFAIHRLTTDLLQLHEREQLPLTRWQRAKYSAVCALYGRIYDHIDKHPRHDPAVWWHGEAPRASEPREAQIRAYGLVPR